jgi:ketosteroid isomerase-like protein
VETYRHLVAEEVTCFEPETNGAQVKGRDMHLFFVNNSTAPVNYFFEIVDPTFKVYGDTAFAAYTFLLVEITDGGTTSNTENVTRIFHKEQGIWKMVHFHRSGLSSDG